MEKILFENDWISLKSRSYANGHEYVFSHESRCNGHIVVVLPYRHIGKTIQYLIRLENNLAWDADESGANYASITGGVDTLEPADDAVRELWEETGYNIDKKELIDLGQCFGTKSTDTIYHLYSVDLTGRHAFKAEGDGSGQESTDNNYWVTNIDVSKDPHIYVAYFKLQKILGNAI